MNSQKKELTYRVFADRIEELEEKIDRMVLSSEVSYDKKFHFAIITENRKLISDITKSSLEEEEKELLVELISALFKNFKLIDQTIDKLI